MLELIVREGAQSGTTFRLVAERTWVGRESPCEVILQGEGISRVHFCIGKTESGYALADNKSTNGVFVNGVPATYVAVRSGDRIAAGSVVLEVREAADPEELPFHFVAIRKGFEQTPQVIEKPVVLIGRQDACDIQLNDPHVSRRHAELEWTPAGISITDLSSMGVGVYVNGQRIVSQQLRHGDKVLIRPFEIRVVILEDKCLLGIRDCLEEMPEAGAASVPSAYKDVVTTPERAEGGGSRPSAAIASLPDWAQEKAPIWVPTSDIMPNRFRSAMLFTGLFAALGLAAYPWMSNSYWMYSPGPTARVHSMAHAAFKDQLRTRHLASDCAACHSGSAAAKDANCGSCHAGLQPVRKHQTAKMSCASCHREHQAGDRQLLLGSGPTCQSAGCHVQVHRNPALAAVSRQEGTPRPRSPAVAFEAPFDFSGDPGKDFHPEHKKAQVKCEQCHDDAEAEKKVPRDIMRSRCLGCHGFGQPATLPARCQSCHFEHPTKTPDKFLLAASFRDGQPLTPANDGRYGSMVWWLALVGMGLGVPLLYLTGAAGAFGYSYARYRGQTVRSVRDSPIPAASAVSLPAWDAVFAAASGSLPAPVEPKPTDNQAQGGHQRPQIDLDLCVGCGSCVQVCPFEVLEIVAEKAIAVRLADCTGYAACAAECPTNAITLVTGGAMQTVELPQYSTGLETNVAGLYLAGEVTGRALIKVAINQGKKAADSIVQSRPPAGAQQFDVIVVGGGPAGISTALACMSSGLRVKVFEQGTVANTIRNYSRQKFVMAEPVAIPVYGPLWMEDTSKEALLERWLEIIAATELKVNEEEKVLQVARRLDLFAVRTSKGEYTAARVVLAIGKRGSPRKLGVPGEDSSKVAYNLSDVDSYRGQAICVVGGGDSALEVANGLARANLANRVCLVHRGPDFNRAKPRNQRKLENSLQENLLTLYLGSSVLEIRDRSIVIQTPQGSGEVANDFVFVMAGGESPKQFLADCGIGFSQRAL